MKTIFLKTKFQINILNQNKTNNTGIVYNLIVLFCQFSLFLHLEVKLYRLLILDVLFIQYLYLTLYK